jgi:lipopolysaccharide transport system ATP-binding protein
MSHEKLLEVENIGLQYGKKGILQRSSHNDGFWALKDVSFNLYAGETLGVLGHNGAGKSTLLKILAGVIRPDRGEVRNLNKSRLSLLTLQLGFVPYMTGRENIILSGLYSGLTMKQIRDRMEEIIEFADLQEFIDKPINTYSHGMKARLGFSVAIRTDPDILLIDETLGVGDAAFKAKSTAEMNARIQSNRTVVLVTHSVHVLKSLCDRLVWIDRGKSVMEGKVEEVLEAYQEKYN